jgi:hypothetical protein
MTVDGSSKGSPAGGIAVVILAEKVSGGSGDFSVILSGARSPEKDGLRR